MTIKPIILKYIVDDRERKLLQTIEERNATAHERITKANEIIVVEVEKRRLDIADIVLSDTIGIERKGFGQDKGCHDFTASIKDNRLWDQIPRLEQAYERPILLLEGFDEVSIEQSHLNINSIYGMLAKLAEGKTKVIWTPNIEHTCIFLERLAFRAHIKQTSSLMARSCPKELNSRGQRAFLMEGLMHTGPKKAKELIGYFQTPAKVFKAIKHTQLVHTRTGNVKGIAGPIKDANIAGAGKTFVIENQKLLFGKLTAVLHAVQEKNKVRQARLPI